MPIIACAVLFSLLQCHNTNFTQWTRWKIMSLQTIFSKAYRSQAFVVVKEEAIWPMNTTSITVWTVFCWIFIINIYLTLYKWKISGVYSDEFLSIQTNVVMKNAFYMPFAPIDFKRSWLNLSCMRKTWLSPQKYFDKLKINCEWNTGEKN